MCSRKLRHRVDELQDRWKPFPFLQTTSNAMPAAGSRQAGKNAQLSGSCCTEPPGKSEPGRACRDQSRARPPHADDGSGAAGGRQGGFETRASSSQAAWPATSVQDSPEVSGLASGDWSPLRPAATPCRANPSGHVATIAGSRLHGGTRARCPRIQSRRRRHADAGQGETCLLVSPAISRPG